MFTRHYGVECQHTDNSLPNRTLVHAEIHHRNPKARNWIISF